MALLLLLQLQQLLQQQLLLLLWLRMLLLTMMIMAVMTAPTTHKSSSRPKTQTWSSVLPVRYQLMLCASTAACLRHRHRQQPNPLQQR